MTNMYNPLIKAASFFELGDFETTPVTFNPDGSRSDYDQVMPPTAHNATQSNAWIRPSTYKKMWDDAKQRAAQKRALNAAGTSWGGPGLKQDMSDSIRATMGQARLSNRADSVAKVESGLTGSVTGGGDVGISSGFNGTMPGQDEFDAATEKAKAEAFKPWTGVGSPAAALKAMSDALNKGKALRNASFMDQVNGVGLWEALKNHLPKWGDWLGASTMVDGVPNWAIGLGGMAAGGLGLAGLNSLLSKSASARAMQAEDPTLMGTVTPARPTITTGNGMSRLMSIISNKC